VLNERPLTCPEDVLGFFLQVIIVSLCSLVLLMRMARDRRRALKFGKAEEEKFSQSEGTLEDDESIQKLYRDNDDDVDA
jgi:hypothetical protein